MKGGRKNAGTCLTGKEVSTNEERRRRGKTLWMLERAIGIIPFFFIYLKSHIIYINKYNICVYK